MKSVYDSVLGALDGKKTLIGIVALVAYKLLVSYKVVNYDANVELVILGWIGVGVNSAIHKANGK